MKRSQDPGLFERACLLSMSPKYIGPLYPLLFAFGSPGFTYNQLPRAAGRVNKTGHWEGSSLGPGQVEMSWIPNPESTQESEQYICRARKVQLERVPVLFDLVPATVEHPRCLFRGDSACVYRVRYEEPRRSPHALLGIAGGVLLAALLTQSQASAVVALVSVALVVGGWALGRTLTLRQDVRRRIGDIERHNEALDRVTRTNEQRYTDLLEAKSEVEQKVEQRTTELRQATQRLSETLNEIQALDRAKTDFFNNVSHELRSPLTLILAPLEELVAGRTPPGGERAAFQAMNRSAVRLLRLINQLLDLAKIDAGEMKIVVAPVDLPSLIKSAMSSFEAAAEKKGVALHTTTPAEMPRVVLDAAWIESAFTNLLANALRLTKRGGSVRVRVEDLGSDVEISVSDDGPGIAADQQQKVFERFAQGDSTKGMVGGTGIGLALVREAMRLHGGDVRLVSELGRGATFTLTLPRRIDQVVAVETSRSTASIPSQLPPRMMMQEFIEERETGERAGAGPGAALALVVEDNPELREFIANVLGTRYRVQTASDGKKGTALAFELLPDVIVSDVAMPEMDGYQLCRAIRAHAETKTTPILLVTARTEVSSVLQGFDSGANDYILKPFHGRELLARVDVHVRLRRMMREFAVRERHATLGVLAASVAHQVRNPLTSLVSGLPAMRSKLGNTIGESTQELMEVMIDCAQRIERLTADLTDLSRVDREVGGPYRPSDGLRAAIRLVKARLPEAVAIDENIDDAPIIDGRPGDMNHVFLNVLDNAARAVGEQGRILVEAAVSDGAYIIRVGDTGPGIDDSIAKHIYEPFFTTRPAGQGTGLGLAVAQQVIMQCGGQIEHGRSELGGAQFTISIPIVARPSIREVLQSSSVH
ncbi:MAG TPA: ATP-binding protein [Polyangiales bacterium]|nr:ATP-binding protein [Polyangiales bacterium]